VQAGHVLDRGLTSSRLRVEIHELALFHRHAHLHRQAELLEVGGHQRVVVRPDSTRKQLRDLFRPHRIHSLLNQLLDGQLDLALRLATHIGEKQSLVFVLPGHRGHLNERARRVLPELRIDGSESGVLVEQDLIGGERDQGAPAHRVMRDHRDTRPS